MNVRDKWIAGITLYLLFPILVLGLEVISISWLLSRVDGVIHAHSGLRPLRLHLGAVVLVVAMFLFIMTAVVGFVVWARILISWISPRALLRWLLRYDPWPSTRKRSWRLLKAAQKLRG